MGKYGTLILAKNTRGDGKIDDPQEVYEFLKGAKEDDKLMKLLSLLVTKDSMDEFIRSLAAVATSGEYGDLLNKPNLEAESAFQKNLAVITSLASDPNAGVTTVTTNPEWKLVYTDAEDKILLGKRQDNTWYFAPDLDAVLDTIIQGYDDSASES